MRAVVNRETVRDEILSILASEEFGARAGAARSLTDNDLLLGDVITDSIQLLSFIVVLENTFGVKLTSDKLSNDVFASVATVVDLILDVRST